MRKLLTILACAIGASCSPAHAEDANLCKYEAAGTNLAVQYRMQGKLETADADKLVQEMLRHSEQIGMPADEWNAFFKGFQYGWETASNLGKTPEQAGEARFKSCLFRGI